MRRGCAVCDALLTYQRRFCSVECRASASRVTRACERCGGKRAHGNTHYCSRVCAGTAAKTCLCPTCGRSFPFDRLTRARYCSEVCRERSFTWWQALDALAADPARWWTYAELAQALYGFTDWSELHNARSVVSRLRARGVAFERPQTGGWVPARFRLAAAGEAAS